MPFTLPLLVYYLWICLAQNAGAFVVPASAAAWHRLLAAVPAPTVRAAGIALGWVGFQVVLQLCAPGPVREGPRLADGSRLAYRVNGWAAWWLSWAVLGAGVLAGWIPPTALAAELGPLLTVANLLAFSLALALYLSARRPAGPRSPVDALSDYVLGLRLNPRVGRLDLKFFLEGRPGLIAWIAIDLSLAAAQYERHGTVTTAMALVVAFQALYVADYFFHEEAILSTWDIKHERLGWMLCWGNLVWVPFVYTIQAQYLVHHPHDLPGWAVVGIVALDLAGYVVFRGANLQKHRFRADPGRPVWGRRPERLDTARGTPLLVSGWWGMARHANYLGDLLMAVAWSLPCRFADPLPYVYVAYLAVLLVHRERRDQARCAATYGADWDRYCRRVRWRIVPGVY
jgi:delta14-sterol reductase/lamin-B receptor